MKWLFLAVVGAALLLESAREFGETQSRKERYEDARRLRLRHLHRRLDRE